MRSLVLILCAFLPLSTQVLIRAQQVTPLCFNIPNITDCVEGRFREYWEQNGGLEVFGYPITPARTERNRDDGKTYLTQRFERVRFELHPENSAPYDVLLGRVGVERLTELGRDRDGSPANGTPQAGCLWFPEVRYNVCDQSASGGFRSFWESHGLRDPQLNTYQRSLALLGLPLTEARMEVNGSGDNVLTQWFERARLEWHQQSTGGPRVLLGLIIAESGSSPPSQSVVLVGAGDIASCSSDGDEATAELLDSIEGTVFTVGDNVYESGTDAEFRDCYEPSWGRHKARTRPAAGNHEYRVAGASGYYTYFGDAAGDPAKGYYSYDLGAWHIIVLNSNCQHVGGCERGSPQEQWLRADLAAHPAKCTLAYWHHPRWSSGAHQEQRQVAAFWQALYEANAEVVLSGHDHHYERFAKQTPKAAADPEQGIRQFLVGSGGKSHYATGPQVANSRVLNDDTYGVLKLTLHPTSYEWEFVPVKGKSFTDNGDTACH